MRTALALIVAALLTASVFAAPARHRHHRHHRKHHMHSGMHKSKSMTPKSDMPMGDKPMGDKPMDPPKTGGGGN